MLKAGGAQQPLPPFDLGARLEAKFKVSSRDYSAANVLAVLPGCEAAVPEHAALTYAGG